MKKLYLMGLIGMLLLALGACSSSGDFKESDFQATDDDLGLEDYDAETTAIEEDCKPPCAFPREAIDDPNSPLAARLIFFDYDSAEIKQEYQDLIVAHGKYLASYPGTKVRIEGHTDERGSREYNLALGEQRGKSVRRILLLQGANNNDLQVVSFGEELPLDLGHDESAWKQNRRVELVYEDD